MHGAQTIQFRALPTAHRERSSFDFSSRAWAAERGLPVREVEVGPQDRRVKRLFVPVPKEHWQSFVDTFSAGDRLMLKRYNNDSHLMPVVDGAYYLWARNVKGFVDRWGQGHENGGGVTAPAMVVALTPDESKHMRTWFTHRADGADALFCPAGHACMDFIGNIEVAPGADGTNTLRPIPRAQLPENHGGKGGRSAQVPMGKRLFDVLGIARSKDGTNMTYNILHAATDRVEVVGLPVGPDEGGGQTKKEVVRENGRVIVREVKIPGKAVEAFMQLSDADLVGPLPPQGVDKVVRPVK